MITPNNKFFIGEIIEVNEVNQDKLFTSNFVIDIKTKHNGSYRFGYNTKQELKIDYDYFISCL